jgi:hypothetical protein
MIIISYIAFSIISSIFFLYIYRIYHPFTLLRKEKPQHKQEKDERIFFLRDTTGDQEVRIKYPSTWMLKSQTEWLDSSGSTRRDSVWSPNGSELGIAIKFDSGDLENVMKTETREYESKNLKLNLQETCLTSTRCGGYPAKKGTFIILRPSGKDERGKVTYKTIMKLTKIFVAVDENRYVISYRGDFDLREINSFKKVDMLEYEDRKLGIWIRYTSDWIKVEKDYLIENDRFTEVVKFCYYNYENEKSRLPGGFLAIHIRNSNNLAFDKYIDKYVRSLRRRHFLSSFYIINESKTSSYFNYNYGVTEDRKDSGLQKEIVYRTESLIHGEEQTTERIILGNDGKAYHLIYSFSQKEIFQMINNMVETFQIHYFY